MGGIIGGLLGGAIQSGVSKALQEDAQQYATSFYKQRYQRQMIDMRKAGLNPILSYRTGAPGTAGGTGIASAAGLAGAISGGVTAQAATSQASSAKGVRATQSQLLKAQERTEAEKQNLLSQQAIHSAAQARKTDVEWKEAQTRLPRAELQGQFYDSWKGQPAVNAQEAGHSAKAIWSPFIGPRR